MEESFAELCKSQYEAESRLVKLRDNARKEGSRRTIITISKRLSEVKQLWIEFRSNDAKIRNHTEVDHTVNYLANNVYTSTEDLYREILDTFNKYIEELKKETSDDDSQSSSRKEKLKLSIVNQLHRHIDSIMQDQDLYRSKAYYQTKRQTISDLWDKMSNINTELILGSDNIDDTTNEDLEEQYLETIIYLQDQINSYDQSNRTSNQSSGSNQEVKLPRITIPYFGGDYSDWSSFQDLFTQIIHDNSSLTNAQKMYYLKSNLKGEAAHLIRHLNITNDNYETAWEIITKRFNNRRLLLDAQLEKLMMQANIQESSDQLKQLHDTIRECLFSIQNMGIDISSWDSLIIYLMKKKLDRHTLRLYEESIKNPREIQPLTSFLEFLETRFLGLLQNKTKADSTKQVNVTRSNFKTYQTNHSQSSAATCPHCGSNHKVYFCDSFKKLTPEKRLEVIRIKKFCTNCLNKHEKVKCSSKNVCKQCGKRHNTLLHLQQESTEPVQAQPSSSTNNSFNVSQHDGSVLLATALIGIKSSNNRVEIFRALIDSGSQVSFVTSEAAQKIKTKKTKIIASVTGLGLNSTNVNNMVDLTIQSLNNSEAEFTLSVKAFILQKLTNMLPNASIHQSVSKSKTLKNLQLADPTFWKPSKIDILLGADVYASIIQEKIIRLNQGSLLAQHTKLGWIVFGSSPSSAYSTKMVSNIANISELEQQLEKFWELEDIEQPTQKTYLFEDNCDDFYNQTTGRDEFGRYTVRLPLKGNTDQLGNSRDQALVRFYHLERRFQRCPEIKRTYSEFIDEYLRLGHMSLAPANNTSGYYLPHHAVVQESRLTTKLRVVFDGSAKTTSGYSINDILHTGPTLQNTITSILLKWRKNKIAFSADIEKMYRQIRVHQGDRHLQKILWRTSPTEEIKEYTLNTVTYGLSAAPYLAIRTLKQLAHDDQKAYPQAAQILLNNFYVDDVLSGANNIAEATKTATQLISLLQGGGFILRKWTTNSLDLLKEIPTSLRSNELVELNKSDTIKTLGIYWNPHLDTINFKSVLSQTNDNKHPTKRLLLSETASIFDPCGWISPCVVKAKLLMQDCWIAKISWDAQLPDSIANPWLALRSSLNFLNTITLPRWIGVDTSLNSIYEIHAFCDASERAYATVIYLRTITHNNISIQILTAKTKVAPIKRKLSLPRLELEAAHLLSALVKKTIIDQELPITQIYAWSDSMIVLAWLRGHPSKWRTFVANRVSNIHSNMKNLPWIWNHVKSDQNPADCASRGLNADSLVKHNLWWFGPTWLNERTFEISSKDMPETQLELRPSVISLMTCISSDNLLLSKYSSLNKTMRVAAYCLRFLYNCRQRKHKRRKTSALTADEIHIASAAIIRMVQIQEFPQDILYLQRQVDEKEECNSLRSKSKLLSLNPILDFEGILRVGGRLENSSLPYSEIHPIILPANHHITNIIIRHAHENISHGGNQATLTILRTQYWIIDGKNAVKRIIHKCIKCHRLKATTAKQLMGALPSARVTISPPFYRVGIDYAGPFQLSFTRKRGTRSFKGYIALFICLVTRAIHLEIVSDMTSKAFIAAFQRFIGRRGLPHEVFSDNGTNFVGASRIIEQNHKNAIRDYQESLSNQHIQWHFNPPSAPHFGGLWEAGVKSTKFHLKRMLDTQILTYEEFETIIINIEACLNSRPLCPLSNDIDDLRTLTPGHFLIGRSLKSLPTKDYTTKNINLLDRWEIIHRMHQEFWKNWRYDYLTRLQQRNKWKSTEKNIEIGHIVILKDDQHSNQPYNWPLARVVDVHTGPDNLVRVVTVKTKDSIFKRPISKVSPLPISYHDGEEYDNLLKTKAHFGSNDRTMASKEEEVPQQQQSEQNQQRKRTSPQNHYGNSPKRLATYLLPLTILAIFTPTSAQPFLIHSFDHNPGIYFENLGSINLINNHWSIFAYFNMDHYWHELHQFRTVISNLELFCNRSSLLYNYRAGMCSTTLYQLQQELSDIESTNDLITQIHENDNNRFKRALIGIGGTILHEIFGVLAEDDAKEINEHLQELDTNEKYIYNLIQNQTSIQDATLNLFQQSIETINQTFFSIYSNLNIISQNLTTEITTNEAHLALLTSYFQLAIAMNRYQTIQGKLLDALIDGHHGKIHPSLFTRTQLNDQLTFIHQHLPTNCRLPVHPKEVFNIYKTFRVKTRFTFKAILFHITIPLFINNHFEYFKVIPVPIPQSDKFVYINPSAEYLISSLDREQFYPVNRLDWHICEQIENNVACPLRHAMLTKESTISQCEIYLLRNGQMLQEKCNLRLSDQQPTWIPMEAPNKWIYVLDQSYKFYTICNRTSHLSTLNGTGILELHPSCELHFKTIIIVGKQQIQSNSTSFRTSGLNFTSNLFTPSIITENSTRNQTLPIIFHSDLTNDISHLHNQIREQQAVITHQHLSNSVQNFHYAALYTLVALLLLCIILITVKFYRNRQPTPAPRRLQPPGSQQTLI